MRQALPAPRRGHPPPVPHLPLQLFVLSHTGSLPPDPCDRQSVPFLETVRLH